MDLEQDNKEADVSESDGAEYYDCSDGETEAALQEDKENITVNENDTNEIAKDDSRKAKPAKPKHKRKRKR